MSIFFGREGRRQGWKGGDGPDEGGLYMHTYTALLGGLGILSPNLGFTLPVFYYSKGMEGGKRMEREWHHPALLLLLLALALIEGMRMLRVVSAFLVGAFEGEAGGEAAAQAVALGCGWGFATASMG